MSLIEINNIYPITKMSSQLVNPAVLKAKEVAYAMSHKNTHPSKQMYIARFTERYGSLPVQVSSSPAYASHQPPTGQVVVNAIGRKTDPHLGSNEYYTSGVPGVMILRRYNNIFIPQIQS
jgi:hypothetical protein